MVTGSRAEYGLLRWLMEAIERSSTLSLQTIATGMHLAPEFGLTYREIEADGFRIDRKIQMLLSGDTASATTKSMGVALIGFADAFLELQPDLVVVLGDRFETFCAATSAFMARIPIAHLHGGETTEGALDEGLRHAITKMAQYHFVAAEPYRRRVIQLGEHPDRVFVVGGFGVDAMRHIALLDRDELERSLEFTFGETNLLATFHPATLEPDAAKEQMAALLSALGKVSEAHVLFTMPNADPEGRALIPMVDDFVRAHPNTKAFASLGQRRYLSCLRFVDAVVGNSSSGLAEAPSFGIPTVNIGDRQRGRLRATSVIDCEPDAASIGTALQQALSPVFRDIARHTTNPYGRGGASEAALAVLGEVAGEPVLKKTFFDLEVP
ncbi:MAG: UDP-N-acetylglucosamine 2-epimerase [Trueperaceae bacterium]|nr:UDP-N-acetylglucosamine 2-epimerase [Trueperaceae bacterium]